MASSAPALSVLILLLCLGMGAPSARAAERGSTRANPGLSVKAMDESIEEVIRRPEYSWRLPREAAAQRERTGWLATMARDVKQMLEDAMRTAGRWMKKIFDWITQNRRVPAEKASGGLTALRGLLIVFIVVLVALLGVLLYRLWRRNRGAWDEPVAAQPLAAAPNVADENVSADQLPEDGWVTLAKELIGKGEYRLALRAYYLAALAVLAERQLIALASFKSNRDYERELGRRDHALPGVPQLFCELGRVFDRTWYGLHEANAELVQQFAGTVERIKGSA